MCKKTFARLADLTACAFLTATITFAQAPPATLTIHADHPVGKVSPTLYGLMTEEINYSYDGGLYAEMVRNRTFGSGWEGVHDWFLLEDGNTSAAISIDKQTGPSEALKSSLKMDVKQAGTHNQAGVLNDGWWGYPLHPNTKYKGSFYAKADSADADAPAPEKQIVGFCISARREEGGYIVTIDVLPQFRRHHVGSMLLAEIERRLAANGVREVTLETATDNDSAVAFWTKHGYRDRGIKKDYYPGGRDAFVMAKTLPH